MTDEERISAAEKLKNLTTKPGPQKKGFLGRIRGDRSKNR